MWIVGGSIPERVPKNQDDDDTRAHQNDKIYNTCICINPNGIVVAKHRKVHLFDIDVPNKITFRESDTLTAGDTITTFDEGDVFGTIGIGICYDIRFPQLSQCMIDRGCRILIYPGAFNLTTGPAHWELLQRARAVDGQCYVLTVSPARTLPPNTSNAEHEEQGKRSTAGNGKEYPHYTAWGHSTAVSPWGEVIATCDEREHVVIVDLDMEAVGEMRRNIPTFAQKRSDLYSTTDYGATENSSTDGEKRRT